MMDMTEQTLLARIREARFASVELREYLDTHPEDEAANADYYSYSEKLNQLLERYEQSYGPLLNFGQSVSDTGCWVYQKWPWQQ